MKNKRTV